jgi:PHD/YefM family antitoxin component YafN of YafNO toxin-antitoxin module
MQYLSVQEFAKSPQAVLSSLSRKRKVVLTRRGKPSAFLIKTDDKDFEILNNMFMQIECKKAISDIRAESKRNGNSKMSMKEINAIISEVRTNARKEK